MLAQESFQFPSVNAVEEQKNKEWFETRPFIDLREILVHRKSGFVFTWCGRYLPTIVVDIHSLQFLQDTLDNINVEDADLVRNVGICGGRGPNGCRVDGRERTVVGHCNR